MRPNDSVGPVTTGMKPRWNSPVRWSAAGIGFMIAMLILPGLFPARAAVKLRGLFGDHMVVQRDRPVPVWGTANRGVVVVVQLGEQEREVTTDQGGRWRTEFEPLEVGRSYRMTVTAEGSRPLEIQDILAGEVWLASGQSNMEWSVGASANAAEEIRAADHPNIRMFDVPNSRASVPRNDVTAKWSVCSPETVGAFSAVAYYFGRELLETLEVPIGLINSTWGGTAAEEWTPADSLGAISELQALQANANSSTLYNAMIHPLLPCRIRGVIWYQGESNVGRDREYRVLFAEMIRSWRTRWGADQLPFGFVQLAPYRYGSRPVIDGALLREAQFEILDRVPATGMAVTMDLGNPSDIHPRNKQDVGKRLALWARASVYDEPDVAFSGPLYREMTLEGDRVRLRFDHTGGGLVTSDGLPPSHFEAAGLDAVFRRVTAVIDGNDILVSDPENESPIASVRFAFADADEPNLMNGIGLPASSFRTDDWRDADGDGLDNRGEFIAGTDPLDAISVFRAERLVNDPAGMRLRFTALPGRTYRFEFRDHPTLGNWLVFRQYNHRAKTVNIVNMPVNQADDLPLRLYRFSVH